ncbi:MAG TPA: ABC transporter permease, partial [Glycomyces sp.]|nr:ABC transporter permease [Glycomyces sp.]
NSTDFENLTAPDWGAALAEIEPVLADRLPEAEPVPIPEYSGDDCAGHVDTETEEVDCSWALTRPEEQRCPFWESAADVTSESEREAIIDEIRDDPRCDEDLDSAGSQLYDVPASTDPRVVAAFTGFEGAELDEAVSFLEDGGVLVADPWAVTDEGTVLFEREVNIWKENGEGEERVGGAHFVELPAMAVDKKLLASNQVLLSPAAVERMELVESDWQRQYLLATSGEIDGATIEALTGDLDRDVADGTVYASFIRTDYVDRGTFYMVLAATGLCALIALGATAVSTGLIIAEQRRDMTTLGAVGAAPGLRKRFAMWQTVMIAAFGAGLGTLAGTLGYALIREALNQPLMFSYPFPPLYGWELPWAAIGITVLAVPLIAAVGALLFTRARLPSERRLT